jgi:hypothetical protein
MGFSRRLIQRTLTLNSSRSTESAEEPYPGLPSERGNLLKAQGLVAGYAGKPAQDG